MSSPMQSHIWNLACAESFPAGEPVLITVQRQGKTVGLAPLFRPLGENRLVVPWRRTFLSQHFFRIQTVSLATL